MERAVTALLCLLTCAMLAAGCSKKGDSNDTPTEVETTVDGVTYTATIGPAGGTLELLDGARLVIPPGALSEPTEIVGIVPEEHLRLDDVHKFLFLPDGLEFETAARLHIPLDATDGPGPIEGWQWSDLNPTYGEGELTNMQPLEHAEESTNDEAVLLIEHFTVVMLFVKVSKYAYMTVDIPARFLKPGDLLFTLTEYAGLGDDVAVLGWNPGHVGLFAGGRNDCNVDPSEEVIEATEPNVRSWYLDENGNRESFKLGFNHRYLGARRYNLDPLTDSERAEVVDFAREQIGATYSVIFSQSGFGDSLGLAHSVLPDVYNCVGLVEEALDSVGKGALPGLVEMSGSTPLEMYKVTGPVSEIEVYAGELVEIPVYGTVVDPASPNFLITQRGWYCRGPSCSHEGATNAVAITAKNYPPEADFVVDSERGVFTWQTTPEDAGRAASVTFEMKSMGNLTASGLTGRVDLGAIDEAQILRINVLPCPNGGSVCGDGESSGSEACDGDDLDEQTCESLGLGTGEVTCTGECELDTTGCSEGAMCGNGVAEPASNEECDGADLPQTDCANIGAGDGSLSCTSACTYDTSGCSEPPTCGNAMVDAGEECDGADVSGFSCQTLLGDEYAGNLGCDATCRFDTSGCVVPDPCGNNVIDTGEDCDGASLGNATCASLGYEGSGLGCTVLCTYDVTNCGQPICGDGLVVVGELCDITPPAGSTCMTEGAGQGTLLCNSTCDGVDTSGCYMCGDGVAEFTEACDGMDLRMNDCASVVGATFSGVLACDSSCMFDTSGCNEVCATNLGSSSGVRAAMQDGASLGTMLTYNASGRGDFSQADAQCTPIQGTYSNLSGGGAVLSFAQDWWVFFRSATNGLMRVVVDALGSVSTPVALGPNSGSYFQVAPTQGTGGSVAALFYLASGSGLATLMLLDNTGSMLTAYTGSTMQSGSPRRMFVRESGNMLFAAVVYEYFSFVDPTLAVIRMMAVDTTTGMVTMHSYTVDQWSGVANARVWDVASAAGAFDALVLTSPTSLQRTPLGGADLAPGASGTITITGGNVLDFKIAHNGTNYYLAAIVDDGGGEMLKVINLGATIPANIDVTGGTNHGPVSGSLATFEVSDSGASVTTSSGGQTTHRLGALPP